jgi:hypothetical protein
MWAGPACPHEDDTVSDWFGNFAGGATTAHGICRVHDDESGSVRTIFWTLCFIASFAALFILVKGAIMSFLYAEVATSIRIESGKSTFPMLTVCNMSPYRCACQGLYDEDIIQNHLESVLPYLCSSVVAWREDATAWATGAGMSATEMIRNVDMERTRSNAAKFSGTINCDNGIYTQKEFVTKVKLKAMSKFDLMGYLGYHHREYLVRFCRSPSNNASRKADNCDNDDFWSPAQYDVAHGVCYTFNPCVGFEESIGSDCSNDKDCAHVDSAKASGGMCVDGMCVCTLCAHADKKRCKVVKRKSLGVNDGIQLVIDASTHYDAVLYMMNVMVCEGLSWRFSFHTSFP